MLPLPYLERVKESDVRNKTGTGLLPLPASEHAIQLTVFVGFIF